MNILVTGATGFIGRHLMHDLLERGHAVRASVREHAVGESLDGIDAAVHLAARAHVLRETAADPDAEFERVNVDLAEGVARRCAAAGIARFVFMSSIGAMASASDEVLRESSPCRPDTPYGRSKLRAERGVREILPSATIIRAPLVYGPDNPGNMQRIIGLVMRRLPLPLGAVRNRRSLVYVGNLVSLVERCLVDDRARGETFLVDDGAPISTAELVRAIARADGRRALLFPIPVAILRALSLAKLVDSLPIDSSCVRATLGWTPPFTMQEGLRATVSAARSTRRRPPAPRS
jgi:nucleoside-diphosphate-sugar epimerase